MIVLDVVFVLVGVVRAVQMRVFVLVRLGAVVVVVMFVFVHATGFAQLRTVPRARRASGASNGSNCGLVARAARNRERPSAAKPVCIAMMPA
jgi:hypothetical protein